MFGCVEGETSCGVGKVAGPTPASNGVLYLELPLVIDVDNCHSTHNRASILVWKLSNRPDSNLSLIWIPAWI